MTDRYIDPNSGAAPQPGGFVSGGSMIPRQATKSDPVLEAEQEHDGGLQGEQPGQANPEPGFGGGPTENPEGAQAQPEDAQQSGQEAQANAMLGTSQDGPSNASHEQEENSSGENQGEGNLASGTDAGATQQGDGTQASDDGAAKSESEENSKGDQKAATKPATKKSAQNKS